MMTLNKFIKEVYPPIEIFSRKDKGPIWKIGKWTGIRAAYLCYFIGISANLLNVISYFITLLAFYLLEKLRLGMVFEPIYGTLLLTFSMWLDFVDGSIARGTKKSSKIGHYLDDLGPDITRLIIISLLGHLSNIELLLILTVFSGYVIVWFIPRTIDLIEFGRIRPVITIFYNNPISLISVRFIVIIIPFLLIVLVSMDFDVTHLGIIGSFIYIILSFIWMLFCLPHYKNKKNVEDVEKIF